MDRLIVRRFGFSIAALAFAFIARQAVPVYAAAGAERLSFRQRSTVDMLHNNPNGPKWLEKFNRVSAAKVSRSPNMAIGNNMKSMRRSMEEMTSVEHAHMQARCMQMMQMRHNVHRKQPH